MEEFGGLTFSKMTAADIPTLTPIMTRAFNEDSRLFFENPVGGPPGYDDGSFLQKWGIESGAHAYRVDKDGKTIGAMIIFIQEQRKEGMLGCIFVDPDEAGKGLGYTMWRFAEESHKDIKTWYTETPAVSYRNHRFYVNKCGFSIIEVDGGMDRYEAQFKMKKVMGAGK